MFRGSSGHLKFDKNQPVEDLSWRPLKSTHLLLIYLNWLNVPSQLTHNFIFQSSSQQRGPGHACARCDVHRSGPVTCAWHGSSWPSSPTLTPFRSRPSATSAWPKPPTLYNQKQKSKVLWGRLKKGAGGCSLGPWCSTSYSSACPQSSLWKAWRRGNTRVALGYVPEGA